MTEDRRKDSAQRSRVDEIQVELTKQLLSYWRKTKVILAVIVASLLILGTVSVILWVAYGDQVAAIQQSREDQCNATTARNQATKITLDARIALLPSQQQREARASEGFTKSLIDAIAPPHTPQQCAQIVTRS